MSLIETFARGRFVVMRGFFEPMPPQPGFRAGVCLVGPGDLVERGGVESSLVRPG
jgi:hypothetical protein